jgi:hypothetical protein
MRLPDPLPLRDAETDFVWVIVPFSRPERLEQVLANFSRQKFPFKKLVLVANGAARRIAEHAQLVTGWSIMMLTSDAHQSIAKNTALHEIRKRGGGFTVVMDDDDYYGPQYLTEACGYANTYDVIGKSRHFMSVDGNLWLCGRELRGHQVGWLTGGTIACWAESAPEYPQLSSGEDAAFCALAESRGMRIFGTDLYHYLYRRESKQDHAWRIGHEDLRMYESARGALDLGDEDLDVVNGNKLEVDGQVLGAREDAATLAPPAPEIRA